MGTLRCYKQLGKASALPKTLLALNKPLSSDHNALALRFIFVGTLRCYKQSGKASALPKTHLALNNPLHRSGLFSWAPNGAFVN